MAKYGILVAIDGLVSSPRCKATQNGHVGSGGSRCNDDDGRTGSRSEE